MGELATKKQLDFIADMEEMGCGEFKGKTKKEASEYIDRHIYEFELAVQSNWQLNYN